MAARKSTDAVVAQPSAPIIPAQPFALKAGVAVGEAAVASARSATLFGTDQTTGLDELGLR